MAMAQFTARWIPARCPLLPTSVSLDAPSTGKDAALRPLTERHHTAHRAAPGDASRTCPSPPDPCTRKYCWSRGCRRGSTHRTYSNEGGEQTSPRVERGIERHRGGLQGHPAHRSSGAPRTWPRPPTWPWSTAICRCRRSRTAPPLRARPWTGTTEPPTQRRVERPAGSAAATARGLGHGLRRGRAPCSAPRACAAPHIDAPAPHDRSLARGRARPPTEPQQARRERPREAAKRPTASVAGQTVGGPLTGVRQAPDGPRPGDHFGDVPRHSHATESAAGGRGGARGRAQAGVTAAQPRCGRSFVRS